MRNLRQFGSTCQHTFVFKGLCTMKWYYGAGLSETKYKQFDVVSQKDATCNTNIWDFMSEQYRKMIVNKVTFVIYNLNIMTRVQQDGKGRLDYKSKDFYPFVNDLPFQYQNLCGNDGTYVRLFRSYEVIHAEINLSNVSNVNYSRLHIAGWRGKGKRSKKYVYYPRYTKTIGTGVANMCFNSTIGEIINKISPKVLEYFRFCVGFGHYVPGIPKTVKRKHMKCNCLMNVRF